MTESKPTVFVLDDDQAVQDSLVALFIGMDLPAEFYLTVEDFFENYDPSRPGCLLLDVWLPGGGLNVLKKLTESQSILKVIVVTGHGDSETKKTALELGAHAFFEKPCDSNELCKCIRQAMEPMTKV